MQAWSIRQVPHLSGGRRARGLAVTLRDGLMALFGLILSLWVPTSLAADTMSPEQALVVLTGKSFSDKEQAINLLAGSGQPYVATLFAALESGNLYYRKSDKQLVVREASRFIGLQSGQAVEGKSREFKRVGLNNALREQLAALASGLALSDPDADKRLEAVKSMLGKLSVEQAGALQARLAQETDPQVQQWLSGVIAFTQLDAPTRETRLTAIDQLAPLRHPLVLERFKSLAQSDNDAQVRHQAGQALKSLQHSEQFYSGIETLYFGISLGSVLVLAGIGLAITFGVMGVINMAHGELMMLGAYTTFVLQQWLPEQPGLALLLSVPAAFVVSGSVGILIERSVIRFLYGRPLETLLATFGISLLLQQAVRSIFSPLNQTVVMPSWMSGTWVINDFLSLTLNRLVIIGFSLLVFAGLMWLLKRSRLGLEVRAVSQNRAMARNMGVRSARVNALTFGLGSGIAGIAGVALSQLTNVGPNLGQSYIIDAFMVVVFGGVGNLWGTLVAGLTLGVANKLLEPLAGAMLAKILILVAIILFIQKRPRGLFPQRGRAVEG